jgi:hypothetical protein
MASIINADTSDGLKFTSDTSGEINLQSGGATIATIDSSGLTMASGKSVTSDGLGKILQVVQDTKTDTFSTTSTSFVEVTGLSVSITPSSASSKILLISTFMGGTLDSDTAYIAYTLYRDATNVGDATYGLISSRTNLDGFSLPPFAISYLDSPSTTSAITYKMYMKSSGGETAFVNRTDFSSGSGVATLIALEVGA